eukprot:TRINITY_DN1864_c0_g1_i2.p1 TRINITY_DN1864_c0_g1~~TRINITY_DN1864_c0_g1_i2.p1  ORF type:complete len:498 (+),score=102.69 TRINITY_DN1864_c0_g1_i2:185-1678(+)
MPYSPLQRGSKGIAKDLAGSYSFLKPFRIKSEGCDLINAIQERYSSDSLTKDADDGPSSETHIVTVAFQDEKDVQVELIGMNEIARAQANLEKLLVADLRGSPAAHFIDTKYPTLALTELDLSDTLISDWQNVAKICQRLPQLTSLSLGKNRFKELHLAGLERNRNSKVHILDLSATYITWKELTALLTLIFPNVTTLHFTQNKITSQDLMHHHKDDNNQIHTSKLKWLTLSDNEITDCSAFTLEAFGSLETLILRENNISSVTDFQTLPKLHTLELDGNLLTDWNVADDLHRKLPALASLRMRKNPVNDSLSAAMGRITVIGKMPLLKKLNGSDIDAPEREDAEKEYYKICVQEHMALQQKAAKEEENEEDEEDKIAQFEKRHPRFQEMLARFGKTSVAVAEEKATLEQFVVVVVLKCMTGTVMDLKGVEKKISKLMSVQDLKRLCHKIFGVPASTSTSINLRFSATSMNEVLDDRKDLPFYRIKDHCEFTLNENF